MRTLVLTLTAAVLGAPAAPADEVWISLQAGVQHHVIDRSGKPTDGGAHPAGAVDVKIALARHWAVRGQTSYVHMGDCAQEKGCQPLHLDVLATAALLQADLPFGYGDRFFVAIGPALDVRLNTPPSVVITGLDLERGDRWRRASLAAVVGGGLEIGSPSGPVHALLEVQYHRSLTNLYRNPASASPNTDHGRGWRFMAGVAVPVR